MTVSVDTHLNALARLILVEDKAEAICREAGFSCPHKGSQEELVVSLEVLAIEDLDSIVPNFRDFCKSLIDAAAGTEIGDWLAEKAAEKRCESFPHIQIDYWMEHLRRTTPMSADSPDSVWLDAEGVRQRLLDDPQKHDLALDLSKQMKELHDYARNNNLKRIKTRGRYLYPCLSYMLFMFDLETQLEQGEMVDGSTLQNQRFEEKRLRSKEELESEGCVPFSQLRKLFKEQCGSTLDEIQFMQAAKLVKAKILFGFNQKMYLRQHEIRLVFDAVNGLEARHRQQTEELRLMREFLASSPDLIARFEQFKKGGTGADDDDDGLL